MTFHFDISDFTEIERILLKEYLDNFYEYEEMNRENDFKNLKFDRLVIWTTVKKVMFTTKYSNLQADIQKVSIQKLIKLINTYET